MIRNARIVLSRPDDYAARAKIIRAAAVAQNVLLGVGRSAGFAQDRQGSVRKRTISAACPKTSSPRCHGCPDQKDRGALCRRLH